VEAVLIHKHLARLSPRLIPGSSPRSVLHCMAARTGVEPGDFDSTGAMRQLETTGHSDRLWEPIQGQN
jgi:hypothetical protein